MTQRFPLFLRFAPLALIGMAALSAQAAGPLSAPTNAIPNAAATAGTSFNSLSAEDRKKLLATPESEQPSNLGKGLNLNDDRHCTELQQQIKRAQAAAPQSQPDFLPPGVARNDPNRSYQQNSAAVVQYDERSKLEARYHSECNK
jgi:hypothetical protein